MTTDTILDLISQGEGVTIEFKECRNEVAAEVYPTVCSFQIALADIFLWA